MPVWQQIPAERPAAEQGLLRTLHLDPILLGGVLILCGLGLFTLYSATGESMDRVQAQMLRLMVGLGLLFAVAQIHPRNYEALAPWLYATGFVLLLLVFVTGDIGKGAQRWLDLGIIRFQPSEMMKLAVPLMMAWVIAWQPLPPSPARTLLCFALLALPVVLIALQPDLGTAVLTACAGLFVIFLSGLRWRTILAAGGLMVFTLPLLWYVLHDYQRSRILTFLNPERDPLGAGYHIIQSKIAIGSGGLFGKGWLEGTQSQLRFLPERATDFIFAVYAEEFGLAGVLFLLAVYLIVILRGLYIAHQAQGVFNRLLAGSISLILFTYVFVNIGMVTGLLPVVGLPLPLFSYGGTSVVTILAGIGMLMSIQTHRKLLAH